eukprot:CAMPEP_0171775640 /NCGR_PEP_ID=MMETSP0991-20121206/56636_1 /TAXON_ID=483369 /ORGANISM="non described non described, Strain CCMP2098" /LENGTH=70 /DNA_ID=CAMNT_0012381861 /DNA_START=103 /DNA_END=312 /DNA_ORIENTATION=-
MVLELQDGGGVAFEALCHQGRCAVILRAAPNDALACFFIPRGNEGGGDTSPLLSLGLETHVHALDMSRML